MITSSINSNLARPFQNVKPDINTQLPLFPASMIHHNVSLPGNKKIVYYRGIHTSLPYGVSPSRRVLSRELLLKRFDRVRDCLEDTVGLSTAQREVALRLLRFWAYYGQVYVKEAAITAEPGCSHATYWRTVKILQLRGLITVINRFIIRPHAQISNLYRFDRLLILIARYLAEHGVAFYEKWLQPYLTMLGSQFWPAFSGGGDALLWRAMVKSPGHP